MANSRKGREKRRWKWLFPGVCCFRSTEEQVLNHDEKNIKLVKYSGSSKRSSRRGKTVPISGLTLTTAREIVNSKTEIQVVVQAEIEKAVKKKTGDVAATSVPTNQLATDKETVLGKGSSDKQFNKQSSTNQEARSNSPLKLPHTVPLPPPPPRRRKEKEAADGGRDGQKQKQVMNELKSGGGGGGFDPMAGAFIMMVTLVVMLIWGKVCAILSTAAWFYFIPRFTRTNNSSEHSYALKLNKASDIQIDLDSPEYKKKVVLQGFLERNQHA